MYTALRITTLMGLSLATIHFAHAGEGDTFLSLGEDTGCSANGGYQIEYSRDTNACWAQDDGTFECVSTDRRVPAASNATLDEGTVLWSCNATSPDSLKASDCLTVYPTPDASVLTCVGFADCIDLLVSGQCKEIVFFPNGSGTVYGYCTER